MVVSYSLIVEFDALWVVVKCCRSWADDSTGPMDETTEEAEVIHSSALNIKHKYPFKLGVFLFKDQSLPD